MHQPAQKIRDLKNQWLYQQVAVEHPTPESLEGRAVYQRVIRDNICLLFEPSVSSFPLLDVFKVDFHRLTIAFAILQAQRCSHASDKAHLIEFFTQIIYSSPCTLYLGFRHGEPIAAALLTEDKDELLISDVVIDQQSHQMNEQDFAQAVVEHWQQTDEKKKLKTIYWELKG